MQRGDIYLIDLKQASGNVQAGKRPVIVVQNNTGNLHSNTTIVCCITSANKKWLPTHLEQPIGGGLNKGSKILCEQILTINKSDLIHYIGTITDKLTLKRLDKCLLVSLGIGETSYDKCSR